MTNDQSELFGDQNGALIEPNQETLGQLPTQLRSIKSEVTKATRFRCFHAVMERNKGEFLSRRILSEQFDKEYTSVNGKAANLKESTWWLGNYLALLLEFGIVEKERSNYRLKK
jgi:hypothetical protein